METAENLLHPSAVSRQGTSRGGVGTRSSSGQAAESMQTLKDSVCTPCR